MSVNEVINQLMAIDVSNMQRSVELHRAGAFQSRTVKVGDEECSIDQLITTLGDRIKTADVAKDDPDLEKLKAMLTSVSAAERENRGFRASLFHLFSSRDKEVVKLSNIADVKIDEHRILDKLKNGHSITFQKKLSDSQDSDLKKNIVAAYAVGKPIHRDEHFDVKEGRIYVNFAEDSKDGVWKFAKTSDLAQEIKFYIDKKDDGVNSTSTFRIALMDDIKNGDLDITAEDIVRILEKRSN